MTNDETAYVSVRAPAWSGLAPPATLMAAMLFTSCWFGLLRFTCQTIHTMRVSNRAHNYMHDVLVHASVWITEHTDEIYRSAFPKLCCYKYITYLYVPLQFSLRASQRTKIVTNVTSTWLAYV